MAQASSRWQQLFNQAQGASPPKFSSRTMNRLVLRRFRGPGGWLIGLTAAIAMLIWNWKLLTATAVGMSVMLLVYLMQDWNWRIRWDHLLKFLSGPNRQLTLAVGSGGIATLSTYMAASIWADSESPWIASGAILQGFGTLAVLVLLVWQMITRQGQQDEANFNQLIADLANDDPLKRLIAVRQITQAINQASFAKAQHHTIAEYFRLMLSREQESVVRDAVLDGLQALGDTQKLGRGTQPLKMPVKMPVKIKRSPTKIHH